MAARKTKSRPTNVGTPAFVSAETYYPEIYPDKLDPHPANPLSRSDSAEVDELMQSIEMFGQRERVRVRPNPHAIGRFEILSGHRRAKACQRLDRPVRCEVVGIDDDEALREVMLGNAQRKDLDAIQRAELLQTMLDAGVDKTEAGKLFGLNSPSGIKNTLRLLKLPESIRTLIRDRKIPSRAARYLVPYAEAHVILDDLAKSLDDDEWAMADFISSSGEWTPDRADYRPMDGQTEYNPGWQYEKAVRKFDLSQLTPEQMNALAIVEIPVDGKTVEVAQNVELFDELNAPHIIKTPSYGSERKSKQIKPAEGEKLTPAQVKAEEKRKAKEADERLKKRIPIWIRRFKRCCLATQTPAGHHAVVGTLPYWLSFCFRQTIEQFCIAAADSLGVPPGKRRPNDCQFLTNAIATMDNGTADAFTDRLWRILLWPQKIDWKLGPKADKLADDTPISIDGPPSKMIADDDYLDIDEPLDMIVRMAEVSLFGGWIDAATEGNPERLLLRELLEMHTTDQLMKFARSLGCADLMIGDKKSFIIDTVMTKHTFAKPLPMPEFLAEGRKPSGPTKRNKK